MGVPLNQIPRTWAGEIGLGSLSGALFSQAARTKIDDRTIPTVPTAAGTTEVLAIAGFACLFAGARITFKEGLVASDTNYVTFQIVNKGQAGAGTTQLLAATDANTTKSLGDQTRALSAYGKRTLTSHGTAANLVIAAGDVLAIQIIGAGTLPNTLTQGAIHLLFDTQG